MKRRRFVNANDAVAAFRGVPSLDLERLRAKLDVVADPSPTRTPGETALERPPGSEPPAVPDRPRADAHAGALSASSLAACNGSTTRRPGEDPA